MAKEVYSSLPQTITDERTRMTEYEMGFHKATTPDEVLRMRMGGEMVKYTWGTHNIKIMRRESSGPTDDVWTHDFEVENNPLFHYLAFTELSQPIYALELKDEFKKAGIVFRWTSNLLHAVTKSVRLSFGSEEGPGVDKTYFDILRQCIILNPKEDDTVKLAHERLIGNIDFLTKWTTNTPVFTMSMKLPFSYSRSWDYGFPIFMLDKSCKFIHQVQTNSYLSNLIRIGRMGPDGVITRMKFDIKYFTTEKSFIPSPSLYATYTTQTKEELTIRQDFYKKNPELIMEDIVAGDEPDFVYPGTTPKITIHDMYPVHWFVVVAENDQAVKQSNDYSNYSDNPTDVLAGSSPITSLEVKYGDSVKLTALPEHFYTHNFFEDYFGKVPTEPGYTTFPPGFNCSGFCSDAMITPSELHMSLVVHMAGSTKEEGYEGRDDISESTIATAMYSSLPKYKLRIRKCTYRRFIFSGGFLLPVPPKRIAV